MSKDLSRFILFDFDGVLVDSAFEMMLPAYNAVTGAEVRGHEQLPKGYAESFMLNRPHMRPAGDAIPLAKLSLGLSEPKQLNDEEWSARIAMDKAPVEARGEQLFSARRRIMADDKRRWLEFNRPYSIIWKALQTQPERVIILTNKNRMAVEELTSYFGLQIPAERIFTGDGGVTKQQNLKLIEERFGASRYLFLEDSLENLIEVYAAAPQMIYPVLASWGYLRKSDAERACGLGIEVSSQEQFVEKYL